MLEESFVLAFAMLLAKNAIAIPAVGSVAVYTNVASLVDFNRSTSFIFTVFVLEGGEGELFDLRRKIIFNDVVSACTH